MLLKFYTENYQKIMYMRHDFVIFVYIELYDRNKYIDKYQPNYSNCDKYCLLGFTEPTLGSREGRPLLTEIHRA